jgi:hypothetical protein
LRSAPENCLLEFRFSCCEHVFGSQWLNLSFVGAGRLSDEDYRVPAVDYVGRPVLTGAPEEVGANAEEEWELAYEEMEQVDRNTKIYNWRDEQDERVSTQHTR